MCGSRFERRWYAWPRTGVQAQDWKSVLLLPPAIAEPTSAQGMVSQRPCAPTPLRTGTAERPNDNGIRPVRNIRIWEAARALVIQVLTGLSRTRVRKGQRPERKALARQTKRRRDCLAPACGTRFGRRWGAEASYATEILLYELEEEGTLPPTGPAPSKSSTTPSSGVRRPTPEGVWRPTPSGGTKPSLDGDP